MKCPGQDMKYWKSDSIFDIACPKCNATIEFYKDDTTRKCSSCGHRLVNPKMDFGCASYCQFAEQCLGTLPEEFVGARDELLRDKVAVATKRYFQTDFKRIRQAVAAANHAETIAKAEGGQLAVILCATLLHGIDLDDSRAILDQAGAAPPLVEEVCQLLQLPADLQEPPSLSARIVHDSLALCQLQDALKEPDPTSTAAAETTHLPLFTTTARALAREFTEQYR